MIPNNETQKNLKFWLIILISIGLNISTTYSQNKAPKNLKRAVQILDKNYSDSLKQIVIKTDNSEIQKLAYPWGSDDKTIHNWTSDENDNSRLVQYLEERNIKRHKEEVILIAFKEYLINGEFDEEKIINPFRQIEEKWQNEDKARYSADSLRDVYIPKNLEDCFKTLDKIYSDSIRMEIEKLTEKEYSSSNHLFGIGIWMRNNWQLWGGSRLSSYFNKIGIHHPDDMSGIIMKSYHKYLNGIEIKLDEQVKFYQDYWKKSEEKELKRKQEEFNEYNLGDTVTFLFNNDFSSKKQEDMWYEDDCEAIGVITSIDTEKYNIKVVLLESCGRKGIISYDNKNSYILNEETKKWEKPKKRIIKYLKKNQEQWFYYNDWEVY